MTTADPKCSRCNGKPAPNSKLCLRHQEYYRLRRKTRPPERTRCRPFPLEYKAYSAAKQRCRNGSNKGWKNYGGRGIKFLFTSFDQFIAALGPHPGHGYTLDRIDNDGHYEPGNVRWATWVQQASNKRAPNGKKCSA